MNLGVQVLAGVMLPTAIIFLQLLLNDKALLGDKWANMLLSNLINRTAITVLSVLSGVLGTRSMIEPECAAS